MKKIFIIDSSPRKNMNTAQMIQKFMEGVNSFKAEIDVKHIRLYDLDFHGCYSCMLCKMKNNKFLHYCGRKDGATDILQEAAYADGLVFASPIYYGDFNAQMKAFFERLTYPWLNYEDYSKNHNPKPNRPSAIIYTMNAGQAYQENMEEMYQRNESLFMHIGLAKPERIKAICTKQVADYSKFNFTEEHAALHNNWHNEHFADELHAAFEAGKRMANKVATME